MPFRVEPDPSFAQRLAQAERPQAGMWVCSGSPLIAEICAGSGLDWLLVDAEHSPNGLESLLAQLQTIAAYPITPLVRVPYGDTVTIKQFLDLGAQNLLVPMVNTAEQAAQIVRAMRYPPDGVRGVGSALARSARWNRVEDYLGRAREIVSLFVQIESAEGVENVEEIVATDGVDGIFVGPSDLSASMGLIGQQEHPDVLAGVRRAIAAAKAAAKPVGVNAFAPKRAHAYLDEGVDFILVQADVSLLARGSEALTRTFIDERAGVSGDDAPASY